MISGGTRYTDGRYILTLKCQEWNRKTDGYDTITEDLFAPDVVGYDRYMGAFIVIEGAWQLRNMLSYAMEWASEGVPGERVVNHEVDFYPGEIHT